jgi:hypothetical protein
MNAGPQGVLCTRDGRVLVADESNQCIRCIRTADGSVTKLAGSGSGENKDGVGLKASIWYPFRMCFDESTPKPDTAVYITAQDCMRRLDLQSGT